VSFFILFTLSARVGHLLSALLANKKLR